MMQITRFVLVVTGLALGASDALAQCPPAVQRLMTERRLEDAKTQIASLIAKSPKDHAAIECLGRIQFAMARYHDAADQFAQAIKIDGNVASHHLWLGNALGNVADSTSKMKLPFLARRVKAEFDKTVALDPTSVDGREGLVSFYSQAPGVMGGSMEKAEEQLREMIKLNPMRGHLKAAEVYTRVKRTADVERHLIAAEQVAPDSLGTGYALGAHYQNTQRWANAFAVYDRMLKQFPNELMVHFQIGRTAALSGDQLERGERDLRYVIANAPPAFPRQSLAGAHHRLGMIYEKQAKKDLARAEYETALSIDPRNENAKRSLAALR